MPELETADDLPTNNTGWMNWFHTKLTFYRKSKNHPKALEAAKGLMQMVLLFELDGSIVFRGLCNHIAVPKFNLHATLVFDPECERICTLDDKQVYYNHIAYLIRCGYSLEELVPNKWKDDNGKWLALFTQKTYITTMDEVVNCFLEKQAPIATCFYCIMGCLNVIVSNFEKMDCGCHFLKKLFFSASGKKKGKKIFVSRGIDSFYFFLCMSHGNLNKIRNWHKNSKFLL